ncbi:MAG: AI-2E family transporter [Candidatus Blackburnbacteria bacterium]|nr:AI-2E family transporter [Candidatus Blackburnbacteria bacterium]
MGRKIEISHRTIVFAVLFLGLVWVVVQILGIIVGLFIAVLLMTALNPIVERLTKFHLPRVLAILVAYLILIACVALILIGIVPPLVEQTTSLVDRLPMLFDDFGAWLESLGISGVSGETISAQVSQVGTIPVNLVRFSVSLFSNIISVFTVLIITFYLLLERQRLDKYLMVLLGEGGQEKAKRFIDQLEARLGGWVRGEMALMLIIGVITYLGLLLLGVPFAVPLAILAGIFEIVPGIGPVLSAIPAVLVALSVSPVIGLATVALYFLVQQLENGLIAPKVLQKTTGVNPLVTMVALAIGLKLGGALGAILAVPLVIVFHVASSYTFSAKNL